MSLKRTASPTELRSADHAGARPEQAPPSDPAASEGSIFSILGQYAVMQLVLAGTGLVRNKIVATRLGPAGFGEIS
jgi:hypothetical protein